ncbi:MAG: exo-alpha-sialidase [Phycisphaeraceae bacterium]|nr:exo-alpha-sialidase [Phycisphaeraceae bacterium]
MARLWCVGTMLAVCLGVPTAHSSAAEPPQVIPGRESGRSIVLNPDGSWTQIRVRSVGGTFMLSQRNSADNGQTWGSYSDVLALPDNEFGTMISSGLDADGDVQAFLVRKRDFDQPGIAGVDRFLDLYQTRSSSGRTAWVDPPQLLFEGFIGQLMAPTTLADGRILMPFHSAVKDRTAPTGASISTVAYSDDRGQTWTVSASRLTAPVATDFNGSLDGAVEPIIIDQSRFGDPAIDRQWMLIRTQDGYLYQSFSEDRGETWSDAERSIFPSSNSAAAYLWLPDRNGNGRPELILFWNNTRICPRYEGQGVYSGRDAIHAALSCDGGRTWAGFREVYLDPSRHDTPPTTGDRGTANPFTLPMHNDERVALLTGNGPAEATIFIDPDWLLESSRSSDFSNGFEGWSAFTHVGEASGFWRDRVIGPQIIDNPDGSGSKVLHLNNPEPRLDRPGGQDGDGAIWNFPLGSRGRMVIRMRITAETKVADIQLTDRFLDPADDTSIDVAVFHAQFNSRGQLIGDTDVVLTPDIWHELSIDWDISTQQALLTIDGSQSATLPMLFASPTGGVSYLRLRSPYVRALDPAGWMVDSVSVTVPEPTVLGFLGVGIGCRVGLLRCWRVNAGV